MLGSNGSAGHVECLMNEMVAENLAGFPLGKRFGTVPEAFLLSTAGTSWFGKHRVRWERAGKKPFLLSSPKGELPICLHAMIQAP